MTEVLVVPVALVPKRTRDHRNSMEVRISKYDPKLRNDAGAFLGNEWASVSDIGRYEGLTDKKYLDFEDRYWRTVLSMLESISISEVQITDVEFYPDINTEGFTELEMQSLEYCKKHDPDKNGAVELREFENLFRAALREIIWFRARGDKETFVHFGSEFYVFLGSRSVFSWDTIAGIYVEEFPSPYSE